MYMLILRIVLSGFCLLFFFFSGRLYAIYHLHCDKTASYLFTHPYANVDELGCTGPQGDDSDADRERDREQDRKRERDRDWERERERDRKRD